MQFSVVYFPRNKTAVAHLTSKVPPIATSQAVAAASLALPSFEQRLAMLLA